MTALRCTAKLLKPLKVAPEPDIPAPTNCLGDWTAHIVRYARKPFVIAVAEYSRIALILPAAPYATLVDRFLADLPYLLRYLHIPDAQIESEIAAMKPMRIAKTNSRFVLASINNYDLMISWLLADGTDWTTLDLMQRIAEDISKPNDYQPTGDALRERFGLAPIIGPAWREQARQFDMAYRQSPDEH